MSHIPETVEIIQPPTFQYIPTIDKSAYVRVELIRSTTNYDGESDREIIYHRYTWDDSVTGTFHEILFTVPFGLRHVSGV